MLCSWASAAQPSVAFSPSNMQTCGASLRPEWQLLQTSQRRGSNQEERPLGSPSEPCSMAVEKMKLGRDSWPDALIKQGCVAQKCLSKEDTRPAIAPRALGHLVSREEQPPPCETHSSTQSQTNSVGDSLPLLPLGRKCNIAVTVAI